MHAFNSQMHEFCQMMQEEVLKHWNQMPPRPASAVAAKDFTEKFLLCPTAESARACIQKDFEGALDFVMALNGVSLSLGQGSLKLPTEWPEYQTRFYVLGCAVLDYIESLLQASATAPTPTQIPVQAQQT